VIVSLETWPKSPIFENGLDTNQRLTLGASLFNLTHGKISYLDETQRYASKEGKSLAGLPCNSSPIASFCKKVNLPFQ
jgi:hypothetical protein